MLWPEEIWPQHIAALAILDGHRLLDPGGQVRIEAVRQAVGSRLHLVPRFRQLLYRPEPRLGPPLWVDASEIDLTEHISVMDVPPPATETDLLLTVEQLRRSPMDFSRPLWRMWILTGLPKGRLGLFVKMHHVIADGTAGVATIATFLDLTADALTAPAPAWVPRTRPTAAELAVDQRWRRRARRRSVLSALEHPLRSAGMVVAALPAMRELFAQKSPPRTSLDRMVGPDRGIALIRASLDEVKDVAHAHGAKVNDVLLTAIAGGLRALLISRGEPVEGVVLRIYMPIQLHEDRVSARGNLLSQIVVPLPIGVLEPAQRLRVIAADTARRKALPRPTLGIIPVRGIVGRALLKLITRQRVNVGSADIMGPPVSVYFAGARLLEVFPILPLIGNEPLGVGAMSYAGRFNIAVTADADAFPDLEIFTNGLERELRSLCGSAGPAGGALPARPVSSGFLISETVPAVGHAPQRGARSWDQ